MGPSFDPTCPPDWNNYCVAAKDQNYPEYNPDNCTSEMILGECYAIGKMQWAANQCVMPMYAWKVYNTSIRSTFDDVGVEITGTWLDLDRVCDQSW